MSSSLSITEFGKILLDTEDLDPVYVAISKSGLGPNTRAKLCLSYWCFYHLGLSAKLAEITDPDEYWEGMMRAAVNQSNDDGTKPFPRGGERRHFRGQQATASIAGLRRLYPAGAEAALRGFVRPTALGNYTYASVASSVQLHKGFGPWIAWKVADMAERVLGYDIDFSNADLGVYKDPRQGAALSRFGAWDHPITNAEVKEEFEKLVDQFSGFEAPPLYNRAVNIQEAETVACKYKSHWKGHYPIGKDTREIRHGLKGWGALADHLLSNMP